MTHRVPSVACQDAKGADSAARLAGGAPRWPAIAVLLAMAVVSATSCAGGAAGPPAPPTVAVARVTRGPLTRSLSIVSELRPYQDVDVHAKVAGYVKEINVDYGSRVKEGDTLATLEIPELADEVQQAEASVAAATSEVARADADVVRAGAAHDVAHLDATRLAAAAKSQPGLVLVAQQDVDDKNGKDKVTEAELATAKAAVAAANGQLDVAKANQARLRALFDYSRITAPFAGIVTRRYADKGTMIQAGTSSTTQALAVVRLAEDDVLRLVIPVPESAVPHIHPGGDVEVSVPVLSRTFTGQVARDANQLDLATRTMHTEVDVQNPTRVLVPGMYASATIVLDHKTNALTVPKMALDQTEQGSTVLLVGHDNVLERRTVTLGIETNDAAEVVSGLAEGDLVVTGSRSLLQPGEAVVPKIVVPVSSAGGL